MTPIIFYDTETNGIPDWHNPSDAEHQPHIVQIAALMVDAESSEVLQTLDLVVRPDGWDIPQETVDIHGITKEYAMDVGVSEKVALDAFMQLWNERLRIGHSQNFDARIVRIALKRYFGDREADRWKEGRRDCTGYLSRPAFGMKGNRIPKLSQAYQHFLGKPLDGAHSALADAYACMELYFAIRDASAEEAA